MNGHDVVTLGRDVPEHVMFFKCRNDSSKKICEYLSVDHSSRLLLAISF